MTGQTATVGAAPARARVDHPSGAADPGGAADAGREADRAARRTGLRRLPLLVPAGLALLAGLDAALMLLGLPAPVTAARLPEVHGMLLVLGFVGTLVALERAVALRRPVGYLAPVLLGAAALLLLSPAPLVGGRLVLVAGAAALTVLYVPLWRRRREDAVLVQALGAVLATGAAVLWLGGVDVPVLLPWLMAFVVLTITGERMELARLAMGPGSGATGLRLAVLLTVSVVATLLAPDLAAPLLGACLLVLVVWLAVHDVARRTVRSSGLPRASAVAMLAGYAWLGVAGGIWLLSGPATGGTRYDALVHAVFLGFTLSMIMAHAPVVLPALLRRPLPWHPALAAPLALLHGSLVLRLWVGDALGSAVAWRVGGVLNVVAVLLFVATVTTLVVRGARPGPERAAAGR